MAFLEKFSDAERELIVSLPYRVGMWVSLADGIGGGQADIREAEALKNILAEHASGMFDTAFVHEVIAETYTRQKDWPKWRENLETVPADCTKAVQVVSKKLVQRDVDAFRENLMKIGTQIAHAFREFDEDAAFFVRLGTGIKLKIDKLIGLVRGEKYESESLLNISYAEDMALAELAKALKGGDEPADHVLSGA